MSYRTKICKKPDLTIIVLLLISTLRDAKIRLFLKNNVSSVPVLKFNRNTYIAHKRKLLRIQDFFTGDKNFWLHPNGDV